jgi:hypothetical protein
MAWDLTVSSEDGGVSMTLKKARKMHMGSGDDMNNEMPAGPFKTCTMCRKVWATPQEFLTDKDLQLNGYMWSKKNIKAGLYQGGLLVFTHMLQDCGTSLAVKPSGLKGGSFRDTK